MHRIVPFGVGLVEITLASRQHQATTHACLNPTRESDANQRSLGVTAEILDTSQWCSTAQQSVWSKVHTSSFSRSISFRADFMPYQIGWGPLVATSSCNRVAALRTLPAMVMSDSDKSGCCSASASRCVLTL